MTPLIPILLTKKKKGVTDHTGSYSLGVEIVWQILASYNFVELRTKNFVRTAITNVFFTAYTKNILHYENYFTDFKFKLLIELH